MSCICGLQENPRPYRNLGALGLTADAEGSGWVRKVKHREWWPFGSPDEPRSLKEPAIICGNGLIRG